MLYANATKVLRECENVDECLRWNNQAAAIRSYYKQAKDDELIQTAKRIQLRAWRRLGELICLADRTLTPDYNNPLGGNPRLGGTTLAETHHINHHDRTAARKLAALPTKDFEQLTEQPKPPSLEKFRKANTRQRSTIPHSAGQSPLERRVARYIHVLHRLLAALPPGLHLAPSTHNEAKALIRLLQQLAEE